MNTVMNQLSCGRSASLASVDPGASSWPKGFGCSSSSARVTSERSLAAVSVRCIGMPRVGLPVGLRCTNLMVFCRGISCTEGSLERSGANGNGRGKDDSDPERRGGGSSTSDSSGLGWSTGLASSLPAVFFRFGFFVYSLL